MPVECEDAADADLADLIRAVDHQVRHQSQRSAVVAVRGKSEGASRETRGRWLAILCSSLVVAAVTALVYVGPFAVRERRLSVEETSGEIQKAVGFGVRLVEGHRSRNGALPADLAAVGLAAADGWSYEAGAGHYRLSLRFGGQIGMFDSFASGLVIAPEKGRK